MKHLQIRLEDEEYADFKVKADRSGISQQEAGKEAVLRWARPQVDTSSPLAELSREEESILCAVLEFMRDESVSRTNPITFKPSLIELGKRFAKRRAVST